MRRSAAITMLLLGAAACKPDNPDVKEGIYATADECRAQNPDAAAADGECDKGFQFAREEHEKTAPRYPSKEDCEAQHGTCQAGLQAAQSAQGGSSSSWFMPLMMGYMMGQRTQAAPVYNLRDADARRGGAPKLVVGGTGPRANTVATTTPAARTSSTSTPTVARGGFGSSAGGSSSGS
jgi:uncharacterized protein YgiB involved in biofilm formation